MFKHFLIVSFTINIILAANDTHYKAAVIEYNFATTTPNLSPSEKAETIVNDFINLINSKSTSFDIIVLPESVITEGISTREDLIRLSPLVTPGSNPCKELNDVEYYRIISCSSTRFNSYIVVNIVEKSVCNEEEEELDKSCASDNYNLYNTNVVFDRSGYVIARYRKFNLFGEYEKNVTNTPDVTQFETDFGVTFGTFICFDILFEEPTLWLSRNGTRHAIFPSMWFSEAPFLTALQVQNMYAVATDSTLLASGANHPGIGSGGSGFYLGVNGFENIGIVAQGGNKIFTADLPKDTKNFKIKENPTVDEIDEIGRNLDGFYLKRDQLDVYTTHLINDNITSTYCHEDFCCKFEIEFTINKLEANSYKYRVFVFSGVRSFDGVLYGGVEVCAVSFCRDETLESCGRRITPYDEIEWNVIFNRIEITGTYDDTTRKMQYPNSLLSNLKPLETSQYEWVSEKLENGKVQRQIKLVNPQERLLTFGVYGRDFTRDRKP